MRAPTAGLAVPRSIPQPVVWGQFPSSQSPIIGITDATRAFNISSLVNSPAHLSRNIDVQQTWIIPIKKAQTNATIAANLALYGFPAPSSFPTYINIYHKNIIITLIDKKSCVTCTDILGTTTYHNDNPE